VRDARPRKDHRGVDLISDALPFGRLWYGEPNAISNAIGYAMHRSRSHDVVIRVYEEAGNVIENVSSRGLAHFHHCSTVLSTNDTKSASSGNKGGFRIWRLFLLSWLSRSKLAYSRKPSANAAPYKISVGSTGTAGPHQSKNRLASI
jgi:hypothetical protein